MLCVCWSSIYKPAAAAALGVWERGEGRERGRGKGEGAGGREVPREGGGERGGSSRQRKPAEPEPGALTHTRTRSVSDSGSAVSRSGAGCRAQSHRNSCVPNPRVPQSGTSPPATHPLARPHGGGGRRRDTHAVAQLGAGLDSGALPARGALPPVRGPPLAAR
ncbi:serine palmitoyltransferase 1 [Platysternon megacephalum]|uniref:Serine palmitoyltransferase 1 n=1 Tax=Platysternon megacephalum TaxID=55544 RepID=A0A4D9EXT1_9SAUR|nr:serine palmitoyltransferase 1 [Platysternon megacephalum]